MAGIFSNDDGQLIVIGGRVRDDELQALGIADRVGPGEEVVEVPLEIFETYYAGLESGMKLAQQEIAHLVQQGEGDETTKA